VEDRAELEENLAAVEDEYSDDEPIPRPPHWGGYVVRPTQIEFWQGRPNRLHDRLRYRRPDTEADDWALDRLAP
jgi:pyridoxamine 5'-phosphate oxidase